MADDFHTGSRGSNRTAPAWSTPSGKVTIARRPSHRRSSVRTSTPDRDQRTRRTRLRSSMRRPRASRCGTTSYPRGTREIRSPSMRADARNCCTIAFRLARSSRAALNPSRKSAASCRSSGVVRSRQRSVRNASATVRSRAEGSFSSFSITEFQRSSWRSNAPE